jgi:hypothetical protein
MGAEHRRKTTDTLARTCRLTEWVRAGVGRTRQQFAVAHGSAKCVPRTAFSNLLVGGFWLGWAAYGNGIRDLSGFMQTLLQFFVACRVVLARCDVPDAIS